MTSLAPFARKMQIFILIVPVDLSRMCFFPFDGMRLKSLGSCFCLYYFPSLILNRYGSLCTLTYLPTYQPTYLLSTPPSHQNRIFISLAISFPSLRFSSFHFAALIQQARWETPINRLGPLRSPRSGTQLYIAIVSIIVRHRES